MAGSVGKFVRRNDEPQSGQDARSAELARRQAAAAQAKVGKNSRPPTSFQQSQPQQQYSLPTPLPLHQSHSVLPNNTLRMPLISGPQNFLDSEVGSDFDDTIQLRNEKEEHVYDESDDDNGQTYDIHRHSDESQEDQAYFKDGRRSAGPNSRHAGSGPDVHLATSVPTAHRMSPKSRSYSKRFKNVAVNKVPYEYRTNMEQRDEDEDEDDQDFHRQYYDELPRRINKSYPETHVHMKQPQLMQSQTRIIQEQQVNPANDDALRALLRPSRHNSIDVDAPPISSHHNEMTYDSDPLDSLENSGPLTPDQATPRGNSCQDTILAQPMENSPHVKRTAVELDYSQEKLRMMKYSELKRQAFDDNPKATASIIPESLAGPSSTLEDRLKHFQREAPELQTIFFEQMPIREWEQAGDWFLSQFSESMSKLTEGRRERREISKKFENELAAHEGAVQRKIEGVDQVLAKMKQGGQGVLQNCWLAKH